MKKITGLFILLFLTSCTGMVLQAAPVDQAALEVQAQPPGITVEPQGICVPCASPIAPTPDCSLCATAACANGPTKTNTPAPQNQDPTITPTPTQTFTPEPTVTPSGPRPFKLHPGSPVYMPSLNGTCAWTGVGGMVMDETGQGIDSVVVVVSGRVRGVPFENLTLTGLAPYYGATGGYEVQLSNQLFNSNGSLFITLFDLAGRQLTDPVSFDTTADCGKNRVIMSFQKNP